MKVRFRTTTNISKYRFCCLAAFPIGFTSSRSMSMVDPDGVRHFLQVDPKTFHPNGSFDLAVISAIIDLNTGGQWREFAIKNEPVTAPKKFAWVDDNDYVMQITNPRGDQHLISSRKLVARMQTPNWRDGPIATTWWIRLTDQDFGFDNNKNFRPSFVITAWNSGVLEAAYSLMTGLSNCLDAGPAYDLELFHVNPQNNQRSDIYSEMMISQPLATRWIHRVNNEKRPVDVDIGLADTVEKLGGPRLSPPSEQATIAYAGKLKSSFDGASILSPGNWSKTGTSGGDKDQIGIIPEWDAHCFTGLHAIRSLALATADRAGAHAFYWTEEDRGETRRGHPIDRALRPSLTGTFGYQYTKPADALMVRYWGTRQALPMDNAHLPNMCAIPYLITGDPLYLEHMRYAASWATWQLNGAATGQDYGCGPTGQEYANPGNGRQWGWPCNVISWLHRLAPDNDLWRFISREMLRDMAHDWLSELPHQRITPPVNPRPVWNWRKSVGTARFKRSKAIFPPPINTPSEGKREYAVGRNNTTNDCELAIASWNELAFVFVACRMMAGFGAAPEMWQMLRYGWEHYCFHLGFGDPTVLTRYVIPLVRKDPSGQLSWLDAKPKILAHYKTPPTGDGIETSGHYRSATHGGLHACWHAVKGAEFQPTSPVVYRDTPPIDASVITRWNDLIASHGGLDRIDAKWRILP